MLDAKTQFCLTKESLTPYLRGKKKRKKEKGGKKKNPVIGTGQAAIWSEGC